MPFESHRGKHARHAHGHARPAGEPAAPHHLGGSLHVAPPTEAHPGGVWFHDPYDRPEQPHHVHKANGCTDHTRCPASHWVGGPPEREHPHHVEYDGRTGRWGYTRLGDEEIRDLAAFAEWQAELEAAVAAKAQAEHERRREILRAGSRDNPAIAELAKAIGIDLDA